jgi:hypothetical protein
MELIIRDGVDRKDLLKFDRSRKCDFCGGDATFRAVRVRRPVGLIDYHNPPEMKLMRRACVVCDSEWFETKPDVAPVF